VVAAPGAEQPYLPTYIGPTPADPFGGQAFDIFDALERAEAEAATPVSPPTLPRVIEPEIAPEPVPDLAPEPAPALETAQAGPEAMDAPLVGGIGAQEDLQVAAIAPEAPAASREDATPSEPAIKPVLVDATTTPPAERRRGWWRR
jgi:ribonuclease E